MEQQSYVSVFLILMGVILITPLLSERIHLPSVAGLILGGIIVGSHGLGLLSHTEIISGLGEIGLLYLMLNAGLEIDLHEFFQVRTKAINFGLLTFCIPLVMGTALGKLIGLNWPGAILFGSTLSSHTLIALPIIERLGALENKAVLATVGATVFTDISAFVVLAIITGSTQGNISPAYFLQLLLLVVIYAGVILLGLPRIGKWFFQRFNAHDAEFQFVLVVLLGAALVAETIGVHAVVGAFLVGLTINSTLPRHSLVTRRVLFFGNAFFIPVFLLESGMITDPLAFVTDIEILTLGLAVTLVAYVSKLIAAWGAAHRYHCSRSELWVVWGLSQAQAAVTLPTILIGIEVGLMPAEIFNAIMLMILLTSISSPFIVQRVGPQLHTDPRRIEHHKHFDRILVPLANPQTQARLISLADILVESGAGKVYPLHILREVGGRVEKSGTHIFDHSIFRESETEYEFIQRIDSSVSQGILHAAMEHDITMILMGWGGRPDLRRSIFGTILDEVVWKSHIPVLVCHLNRPINSVGRVVMIVAHHTGIGHGMLQIIATLTDSLNVRLHVLVWRDYVRRVEEELRMLDTEHAFDIVQIDSNLSPAVLNEIRPDDLVVITAMGSSTRFRSSLGNVPELLIARTGASVIVFHYARQM
ncbi:MAG: cation:proton antiporter [Chloroflexi bacterium]|nr:cation:proton antiporter [Chloroflexota bacterium]